MATLYNVDSPITREQRNNLNATFQDIQNRFSNLRYQIAILTGGEDLDEIIQSIQDAVNNAQNVTSNTQQVLDDISSALSQLEDALQNSNESTENANNATQSVQNVIAEVQNLANQLGNAETYDNSKTYNKNNIVELDGSSFIAIQQTTGNAPPVLPSKRNDYWQLLARRGMDGLGTVSYVNNISPSPDGNLQLTPSDIGAPNVDALFINVKNPPAPLVAAKGDGSDETAVLQAILNSVPNDSSYGTEPGKSGAIVFFPIGNYGVSSQLQVNALGTVLKGVSIETSVINALPNFTGESVIRFKQGNNGYSNVGIGMEKLGIYMNDVDAHGVIVTKAYDGITFNDVLIRDVADAYNGFRFIPDADNTEKVSQTLNLFNLYAIHKNRTATAPLYHFDTCQEVNLIGCKAFGTYESNLQINYSDAPLCNGFEFINSRGVTMTGCSVAFTSLHALEFNAVTRGANGFAMYGCTFESVGGILKCDGQGSQFVDDVRVISFRREGSIDVGTQGLRGFELNRIRRSYLETKDATVSVSANSERNTIFTEVFTSVTNNGTNTSIIGTANAIDGFVNIEPGISSSRARISNFFADGIDQLSITHPYGASQTSFLLNVNRDGTISKSRVSLGAPDSGGNGFRALVVPN